LEQNYRSTPQILSVAGAVVAGNSDRLGKRLWTENGQGPKPQLHELPDQEEEVRLCCELVDRDPDVETAILYRMNFQSQPFETAFRRLNIPYRLVGAVSFFERQEVKDALAYLILVVNPFDAVAFRRAVTTPRRGIGPKSLSRILASEPVPENVIQTEMSFDLGSLNINPIQRAKAALSSLSRPARLGISAFLELQRELIDMVQEASVVSLITVAIERSGLSEHYRRVDEISGGNRLRNLEQLVASAQTYGVGQQELQRFLEAAGLRDSGTKLEKEHSSAFRPVTLITLHNTKGLEFERVVITGLEEGVFPLLPGEQEIEEINKQEIEEERRLFYVGVTRAKRHLHLTSCARRTVFGQRRDQRISRFLREIPGKLLANHSSISSVEVDADREAQEFPAGAEVYHDDYGSGVVSRRWSRGGTWFVTVRFATEHEASFALS
jgi:DNA helicase-2/ATP-dependent DNA helicase PcrA